MLKYGKLFTFSNQQHVDCSKSFGNNGCSSGNMANVYNYLKANKVMLDADYPYVGRVGTCQYNDAKGVTTVNGPLYVKRNDPAALMNAVAIRPIAIGIAASSTLFQFYKSGVITDAKACGTALNHAVVIVGYGSTADNIPFWIIKNSWGTAWGEAGYVRVKRETVAGTVGVCAVQQYLVYPNLL